VYLPGGATQPNPAPAEPREQGRFRMKQHAGRLSRRGLANACGRLRKVGGALRKPPATNGKEPEAVRQDSRLECGQESENESHFMRIYSARVARGHRDRGNSGRRVVARLGPWQAKGQTS